MKHKIHKKLQSHPLKKIINIIKFSLKHIKLLMVAVLLISLLVLSYFFVLKDIPAVTTIGKTDYPQSTKIYDRNNNLLYTIYGSRNQTFIPLSKVPKHVKHATIAIEDKDFYKHGAIDIRGIIRAFYSTVVKKELQGGSTITQQLVKNSLLTQDRTVSRKVKEIVLSYFVEEFYSKDKILEMYLNKVSYGGTAWGIQAASQVYFDKPAEKLTLAESAFLAGLPEAPSIFSPFGSRPDLAKKRQREVLKKMRQQRYITEVEEQKAVSQQLTFSKFADKIRAPHFVFYVKELLVNKYGEKMVEQGGLTVKTSLDLDIQEFAQATVSAEIKKLQNNHVSNGAAVVTQPGTGEILAMIGSHDYFDTEHDGNVNVAISKRQPGSSIKPINYAVGLLKGFTASTPFIDQPTCYPNQGGKEYCPVNYDGKYHGVVQMRFALANSLNIPAVKMLMANSLESMIATASAMGIKTFRNSDQYGLSLTLGGGEVTMIDMAEAFGVFANSGYRIELQPILKVTDNKGNVLEEYTPPRSPLFGKKVLPPEVTYIISHILLDNSARSMAFGSNSPLKVNDYPVSVKTGTTNDYKDNWTIGYTPSYVVAVWVGNNDNTEMQGVVSGVTGAAPIWHTIMEKLISGKPPEWPLKPDGVVGKMVCSDSGLLAPPDGTPDRCPARFEYFVKGMEPKVANLGRTKARIDKGTQDLAKKDQADNVEEKDELVLTDLSGDKYCLTCPHPTPVPPTPTP